MNWKLTTGCFAGSVVEEGTQILDISFEQLDEDLQLRIRDWADNHLTLIEDGETWAKPGSANVPLKLNDIKELYEQSWESEETDEPADLKPVSEW